MSVRPCLRDPHRGADCCSFRATRRTPLRGSYTQCTCRPGHCGEHERLDPLYQLAHARQHHGHQQRRAGSHHRRLVRQLVDRDTFQRRNPSRADRNRRASNATQPDWHDYHPRSRKHPRDPCHHLHQRLLLLPALCRQGGLDRRHDKLPDGICFIRLQGRHGFGRQLVERIHPAGFHLAAHHPRRPFGPVRGSLSRDHSCHGNFQFRCCVSHGARHFVDLGRFDASAGRYSGKLSPHVTAVLPPNRVPKRRHGLGAAAVLRRLRFQQSDQPATIRIKHRHYTGNPRGLRPAVISWHLPALPDPSPRRPARATPCMCRLP